jgi:hypothetical protein
MSDQPATVDSPLPLLPQIDTPRLVVAGQIPGFSNPLGQLLSVLNELAVLEEDRMG